MNKELAETIKLYSIGLHENFTKRLINLSKESLISLFTDLLTMYINDKNSSTIREFITVTLAGYEHSEQKIGFNGFKQSSIVGGKPIACEAKPKNITTNDFLRYTNEYRKTKPSVLSGGGNFTDYTHARFAKDKKENPHMLISGFIDGKLLYILEIPFKTKSFMENLEQQLNKFFPHGDQLNTFLRSARFTYKDYINSRGLAVVFLLPPQELSFYQHYFNKSFYQKLITLPLPHP